MMNNYTFIHEISACNDENICISHTSPGFLIFSPGPDSDWAEAAFAFLTELFARAELDAKGRHVCVLEPLDLTTWATCGPGRPLDLSHRERWAKLLFERFAVATMYMGARQIFALYTAGETTGVVVDLEAGQAVPVYEGFALAHGVVALRTPVNNNNIE